MSNVLRWAAQQEINHCNDGVVDRGGHRTRYPYAKYKVEYSAAPKLDDFETSIRPWSAISWNRCANVLYGKQDKRVDRF